MNSAANNNDDDSSAINSNMMQTGPLTASNNSAAISPANKRIRFSCVSGDTDKSISDLISNWVDFSRFSGNRFKTALFNGILVDNEDQRSVAIDNIVHVIRSWALHFRQLQSPSSACSATPDDDGFNQEELQASLGNDLIIDNSSHSSLGSGGLAGDATAQDPLEEMRNLLNFHLLIILRMSINCPFQDLRERFSALILELRSLGIAIPQPIHESPSFFIVKEKVVSLASPAENLQNVMVSCFLANGRFSHVYRLMAYFPLFLEKFTRTFNHVMRLQGPLPRPWRHYIAIMASAQHKCQYLVSLQSREFLQNGGDPSWLEGLDFAPAKLQNLARVNTILAHQPWLLNRSHILALTRTAGADNWSLSELVQAFVVLTSFHSLSSFVLGCGVVHEIDMEGGTIDNIENFPKVDVSEYDQAPELLAHTNQLLIRLKERQSIEDDISAQREVFETLETKETFSLDKAGSVPGIHPLSQSTMDNSMNIVLEDMSRFLSKEEIVHVDFDVRSSEYGVFRLQDYNWEEQGCSLIGKYLPATGDLLDEEFSSILNLTDYTIFKDKADATGESVDTWPFRQAVWYYVFRLSGMSHDDYNYHDVNIYLNKRIKQYIKKVACYPEQITPADFHNIGFSFRPDEKIQINLLAAEARRCSSLLYAIKSL